MAKKPQDYKKKRRPKSEMFVFNGEDGTLEVPFMENIPMSIILNAQEQAANEGEAQSMILAGVLGKDWREKVGALSLGEFQEFMERWNEESDISLGES